MEPPQAVAAGSIPVISTQNNPLFNPLQMETISIIFLAMAGIVLTMAVIFMFVFYRPIGGNDIYYVDDAPAHYEDYEAIFYDP